MVNSLEFESIPRPIGLGELSFRVYSCPERSAHATAGLTAHVHCSRYVITAETLQLQLQLRVHDFKHLIALGGVIYRDHLDVIRIKRLLG